MSRKLIRFNSKHNNNNNDDSEEDLMSIPDTVSTGNTSGFSSEAYPKQHYDILPSFYMHQSIVNRNLFSNECENWNGIRLPYYREYESTSRSNSSHDPVILSLTAETSILDNLEKVPCMKSKIDLKIHITKAPFDDRSLVNDNEHVLKEYTSGDYVHGYFTVQNISSDPINFEQITVALEGNSILYNSDTKKQEKKNFLRLLDLSAGYSYGLLPGSLNDSPLSQSESSNSIVRSDGSLSCFKDQTLSPGVIYKKSFTFKFPFQMLDQNCDELSHLILPPSFGIPKEDGRNILFNDNLGYGRSSRPGGPLLMRDFAPMANAVTYSIAIRIVGVNPDLESPLKFAILRVEDYHLRFIPFGFLIPFNYELSTTKQIDLLYKRIKNELDEAKRRATLNLTQDQESYLSAEEQQSRKLEQLVISDFPLHNISKEKILQKSSLEIFEKNINKLKFLGNSVPGKLGVIEVQSDTPINGIQYLTLKLVHKVNVKSNMNAAGKENITRLHSVLSQSEKKLLQNIELELIFKPNKSSTKPPSLTQIKSDLEIINMYSTKKIPFTIDQNFFTNKEHIEEIKVKFNNLIKEFKQLDPKTRVLAKTVSDLNSIINLKTEVVSKSLFKVNYNDNDNPWKSEVGPHGLEWHKHISIQLQLKDSQNLTLVPTFQNCYMSRFYNIKLEVSFGSYGKTVLDIPARVRKFDWKNSGNY